MGYAYGRTATGRYALACDSCGNVGGVRKRPCRFWIRYADGTSLPYCPAPALCSPCFARRGGSKKIHGDACRDGAATSQAREDKITARLEAGDKEVKAAWGSWHADVPEGMTLVMVRGTDKAESYWLIPRAEYGNGGFLSEYPSAIPATASGVRV